MKEGDIGHEEANIAVAAADKTIIFGRQNRLKDGVLLPDEKLRRFHAGHDSVKFFYSAVRQLPEYFLDALLAKNISITLVKGKGLLVFRDVRCHQALHSGRTRRTIYIPEKVLDVAVNNGYDYWSICQILIVEGWKLLDYVLLLELIQAGKQYMLEHSVAVLGWNAVRRILAAKNKHRSTFESEELAHKRELWGLDVPISEIGEFIDEYEEKLLRAMRFGGDGRLGRSIPLSFRQMSPEDVTKALYNEHLEESWATRKAGEICEEMSFPDYFLLDRDIVHPAARELAEANGQDITPQNMVEARHDYQDRMRFGIGRELATEWVVAQGMLFAPEGLEGLVEEVVAGIFVEGRPNSLLLEWTQQGMLRNTPGDDKAPWQIGEDTGQIRFRDAIDFFLGRGIDLIRLRELVQFYTRVKSGEQKLELEHVEMLRDQMVALVEIKGGGEDFLLRDQRRQMILMLRKVDELFEQLKALLIGEAKRLIDPDVQAEHVEPPDVLMGGIERETERAMLRLTLCLELMPDYHGIVERLARRGTQVTEEVLEEFLGWAKSDPGRQIAVAAARRGLTARRGERKNGDADGEDSGLGNMYERVAQIVERLPERLHEGTSEKITPLRRAMREFENMRRASPTHPNQLGALAMVLVRLDRCDQYEELLEHVRWMGDYAVGNLVKGRGLNRFYTPGLLRVIDEIGPQYEPIGTNAVSLAEELTGVEDWEVLKQLRVVAG